MAGLVWSGISGGRRTARKHRLLLPILAVMGAGLALSCGSKQSDAPPADSPWPLLGRDQMGQHYTDVSQINAGTIDRLGFAFEFKDFVVRGRTHRGMEVTPLMVDGVLYFSGPWGVAYAVDARTGKHLWTYDPEPAGESARNACCDAVNRGVAVAHGLLFTASTDGHLAAVDIKTGKEAWKIDTIVDRKWNYSSSGAPYLAGDYVIIGNSGADMGARGYASAYDQRTGKLAWRFWVVPGDPAKGPDENPDVTLARTTWPKDARWDLGLGGNPWDGFAFDPDTGTVFIATGNGGPHPRWKRSRSGDSGDELYLSSIVAVDAKTGRRKWHYQTTPGDSWDYAATSPMVMADIPFNGRIRKAIMQAPKNGFFYMLDRETGELLQAAPYTHVNWASRIDLKSGRPVMTPASDYREKPSVIWPSMAGGHAWTPMAYSPRTRLVYLPVYDAPASYQMRDEAAFRPGTPNHGSHNAFAPFAEASLQAEYTKGPAQTLEGRLKAWDPVKGEARWISDPLPFLNGGTLVVGDLVFQGAADGKLRVHDAATGRVLRTVDVGTSIMGAPISYAIGGVQYIAFTAGYGGPQGGFFAPGTAPATYENYERLVVLKLDGKAVPLPPLRQEPALSPVPQKIAATAAQLARGQALFEQQCNRCHVMGGSPGIYPNLWNMPPEVIGAFDQIVGEGAFSQAGMGNFSSSMSKADIEAVKAFIVNDMVAKRTEGKEAGAHYREATH